MASAARSDDSSSDGGSDGVEIGDFFVNRSYALQQLQFGDASIRVKMSTASSTDYDLTGQIPWPASAILAYWILSPAGRAALAHRDVLELGSGVGFTGLLAARIASRVVLSDHNDVILDLLRENIVLNDAGACTALVKLDWSDPVTEQVAAVLPPGGFDVLIGSDVVYGVAAVPHLVRTFDALLTRDAHGLVVVAYVLRWSNVDRAWRQGLAEAGFVVQEQTALDAFMPPDRIPTVAGSRVLEWAFGRGFRLPHTVLVSVTQRSFVASTHDGHARVPNVHRHMGDEFDALLDLEQHYHRQGFVDGQKEGARQGLIEGFGLGYQKGFEIGTEVGQLRAFARFWRLVHETRPDLVTVRFEKLLQAFERLLDLLPPSEQFDPHNEALFETLASLRTRYRQLASLVKLPAVQRSAADISF